MCYALDGTGRKHQAGSVNSPVWKMAVASENMRHYINISQCWTIAMATQAFRIGNRLLFSKGD